MSADTLDHRLALVTRDSKLDPALVAKFGQWIRRATDEELFRIPTLRWAAKHGIAEDDAIDLFLHAARAGIFEMQWGVLCPACGISITTPGGLRSIGPNPHCQLCRVGFPASMDDQVEVTFSVEPAVREVRFMDPERLDPARDALQMYFSPSIEVETMEVDPEKMTLAGTRLAARGVGSLEFKAEADHMYAVVVANVHAVGFVRCVEGSPTALRLEAHDGGMIPPVAEIGPGGARLELTNRTEWAVPILVFALGPHQDLEATPDPSKTHYRILPFLNGKRVLTSQTFRDLFRGEQIGEEGVRIKNLAIVFSDLEASTALYERVGDLRALELVREHFDRLGEAVSRHRGAVVKTIGDAIMAAFSEPDRAVAAAASMVRAVKRIDADGTPLHIKVGCHSGSCVGIQTNHQIDYFGSAVNVAARVQGVAHGGEIVVTDRVWTAPGVQALALDYDLDEAPDQVDLRGIAESVPVHRLR